MDKEKSFVEWEQKTPRGEKGQKNYWTVKRSLYFNLIFKIKCSYLKELNL